MVFRNSKQKVYFNKTEGGNMTIGNKIKNLRNLCQLTQEELADKMEISREYLRRFETKFGKEGLSFINIYKAAKVLNVKIDDLVE